jgi:hypothetical protein
MKTKEEENDVTVAIRIGDGIVHLLIAIAKYQKTSLADSRVLDGVTDNFLYIGNINTVRNIKVLKLQYAVYYGRWSTWKTTESGDYQCVSLKFAKRYNQHISAAFDSLLYKIKSVRIT